MSTGGSRVRNFVSNHKFALGGAAAAMCAAGFALKRYVFSGSDAPPAGAGAAPTDTATQRQRQRPQRAQPHPHGRQRRQRAHLLLPDGRRVRDVRRHRHTASSSAAEEDEEEEEAEENCAHCSRRKFKELAQHKGRVGIELAEILLPASLDKFPTVQRCASHMKRYVTLDNFLLFTKLLKLIDQVLVYRLAVLTGSEAVRREDADLLLDVRRKFEDRLDRFVRSVDNSDDSAAKDGSFHTVVLALSQDMDGHFEQLEMFLEKEAARRRLGLAPTFPRPPGPAPVDTQEAAPGTEAEAARVLPTQP